MLGPDAYVEAHTAGSDVYGDASDAVLPQPDGQGVSMSNYHAVYHPSDENYLAISAGDTFANGATYWPDLPHPHAAAL